MQSSNWIACVPSIRGRLRIVTGMTATTLPLSRQGPFASLLPDTETPAGVEPATCRLGICRIPAKAGIIWPSYLSTALPFELRRRPPPQSNPGGWVIPISLSPAVDQTHRLTRMSGESLAEVESAPAQLGPLYRLSYSAFTFTLAGDCTKATPPGCRLNFRPPFGGSPVATPCRRDQRPGFPSLVGVPPTCGLTTNQH
jgi:hypothetical protein